jgi:uroporphyrinogen-III decarboxylase
MCYAVEGQGSKSDKSKRILFSHPEAAHVYCKITDTTILYLQEKKAGVDAVQVLILGAECLQLIIKNSLGNTSIRLSKLWQIMLQ